MLIQEISPRSLPQMLLQYINGFVLIFGMSVGYMCTEHVFLEFVSLLSCAFDESQCCVQIHVLPYNYYLLISFSCRKYVDKLDPSMHCSTRLFDMECPQLYSGE